MKTNPKYEYAFILGWWHILCDGVKTEEAYPTHSLAKKRVYELNGWTYRDKRK